jgi:hypothetical protein
VLVTGIQRGIQAEVDSDAAAHERFAVEILADAYCGIGVEEGRDYPAEGLKWRPSMDCRMFVDELADLDEICGNEDIWLYQVLNFISSCTAW